MKFKFELNSKQHETDRFITGKELRALPGVNNDDIIYLRIQGKDEEVHDTETVDLAREEIESFYTMPRHPVYKISINNKVFEYSDRFITGKQVRKLGSIDEDQEVYLRLEGQDDLILPDLRIDLARRGVEYFYSKDKHTDVTIIVNGEPAKWDKKQIGFVEVIILAYGEYIDLPTMVYTVGYEDGPKENREGSMIKGTSVFVKNKMIFHATATDKS